MKLKKFVLSFVLLAVVCITACQNNTSARKECIGIIGAMDIEVDSLKELMKIEKITECAMNQYYVGTLGKNNIVVVKSGMGKVNAGLCASVLINKFGCTKIINTGVAGSLDRNIRKGDIVISSDVVQHDFDAGPIGYEKGEIPGVGLVLFEADEELVDKLYKAAIDYNKNVKVYKGRVCTGDQFIASRDALDSIVTNFGGLCCEMEGGGIAQVCYLHKVPFAIIRVISDMPGETSISEYKESEADFSLKCARTVEYMLMNDDI